MRNVRRISELNYITMGTAAMPPFSATRRTIGPQNAEPTPINWRRGMFRVWILMSVAWIMGWIIYLILVGLQGGFKVTGDVLAVPVLLFGPPVALLLFGFATGWAFRGFKVEESPPS